MIKLLTSNITKFKLSTPTIAKTVARLQYIGHETKEQEQKVGLKQSGTGGCVAHSDARVRIKQATFSHSNRCFLFEKSNRGVWSTMSHLTIT